MKTKSTNISEEESVHMSHLDTELQLLNDDILELMHLVKTQLEKGQEALLNFDEELAEEITVNESRVNALELKLDRDCENILALFNPVAIDLRFVLASVKITSDLERLGDHADSIARYILEFGDSIDQGLFEEMEIDVMFKTAIEMLNHVFNAFIREDTKLARKVFSMDKKLNKINRQVSIKTTELIQGNPEETRIFLYLFSIIRKLERVGDLTKNVAEEIVFFIEAKVLKHMKGRSIKEKNP